MTFITVICHSLYSDINFWCFRWTTWTKKCPHWPRSSTKWCNSCIRTWPHLTSLPLSLPSALSIVIHHPTVPTWPPRPPTGHPGWPLTCLPALACSRRSRRDSLGSRHTCICSGSHTQERGSVLGQEGDIELLHQAPSPHSTYFPCCPDQERVATLGVESQPNSYQTSKTTPNSPYLGHHVPCNGGSLLGLPAFPSSGLAPQVRSGSPGNTLSLCTHNIQSQSHPSLNVQMTSDLHTRAPTPIHFSVTPTGPSEPLIAVSSLLHSGICSSSLLHFPTGPRQNDLVGSSPVHTLEPIVSSNGEKPGPAEERHNDWAIAE